MLGNGCSSRAYDWNRPIRTNFFHQSGRLRPRGLDCRILFVETFKAILYVTCFVPETKNKTIEEVQLNFAPPGGSIGEGDSLMTGETSNPQSSSSASSTTGDSI